MNKENYLQAIASFLIALVLTIPLYTTSVYATINKITVQGSNGVEGFAKSNDFLDFKVQASIENDAITKDQVVLGQSIQFDNCQTNANNATECTLRFPSTGTEVFESKSIPFTINLFKDDKTLDDSKSSTLVIDSKVPIVKLTVPKNEFSSQENVVVNYEASDSACDDPSCSGKCVGIKSVELYTLDGKFKQTISLTANANDCNAQSSIDIESGKLTLGKNSVFAKATDAFGQTSTETSVTFTITAPSSGTTSNQTTTTTTNATNATTQTQNPPQEEKPQGNVEILTDTFVIVRKGISLSTYAPRVVPVNVFINISGSDLDTSSVIGDLSPLNPSISTKKASCQFAESNIYTCIWAIDLRPGQSVSNEIKINASDKFGNSYGVSLSKQLSLDDKGPVVQTISTSTVVDGKVFAKGTGNIITAILEDASGVAAEDVFLHAGSARLKPNSCRKESNWVCVWENVDLAVKKLSITTDTKDILGNAVSQEKSVDVILDSITPKLESINVSPVGGASEAFEGFIKIGDKFSVVANLTEENDIIAAADFSKFISDASSVVGTCNRIEGSRHSCTWLTDTINLQSTGQIKFNFSDQAGNSLIYTHAMRTFGLENATTPDFWTNSVSCSPKTIDRTLGPLINQKLFCEVKLKPKSTSKATQIVFISPTASCSGDMSFVEKVESFNTDPSKKSPFLEITLKKNDFNIDSAKLKCSFNIISRVDDKITKNPEVETANISILFYNLPLGELSDEIERKIKDAKDDAEGIWKIIGTLNKLVFYAKKICQLFGIIYNVLAIYYTITVLLAGETDAICTSYFGIAVCPLFYTAKTKSCLTQQTAEKGAREGFKLTGNAFCKFVNCQWTGVDVIDDYKEWLAGTINKLPLAEYLPIRDKDGNLVTSNQLKSELNSGLVQYLNPQTNLITATVFVCLPGIIYSLDKYRQIKCLYADCLKNAVGKEGIPVSACEDLKSYSTCKYVTGELFALIPYTAVFDHFMGLIKNALSNPFTILGVAASVYCYATCSAPPPTSTVTYTLCAGAKLFSTMGEVIGNIKNIIDEGFKIRQDYCSRI